MPRTRHCAQNRQDSITKLITEPESEMQEHEESLEVSINIDDFIAGAKTRQDKAIAELEQRLDEMGDEFAARVRTIVERGLLAARGKALKEVQEVDVSFFLNPQPETLPGNDAPTLEAAAETVE